MIKHCVAKLKQANKILSDYQGCLPAPLLRNHRVFGIDRVGELLRAVRESRLLETLSCYVRQAGNTLEYALLGRTGIATIEPDNIATLLATDKGSWMSCHEAIIMFRC
jgi:hypothetical protein